jgi:hypothetical protein
MDRLLIIICLIILFSHQPSEEETDGAVLVD